MSGSAAAIETMTRRLAAARRITFTIAEAGLVLLCLYQCWPGLAPPSFWLDDLWVSVLARSASLAELIDFRPPVPPGFVVLLKATTGLFGDGHWQLQLPALVCRLAAIPLVGWLAFRLTLRLSAALVALTAAVAIVVSTTRVMTDRGETVIPHPRAAYRLPGA